MKYFFWVALLFLGDKCFSQKKDTITVDVSLKRYVELAQKDLEARYNYTKSVKNAEDNRIYKDTFGCKFITDFKLQELQIKVTPQYSLSKDFEFQGNVLRFIDFSPEKLNAVYSIYDKYDTFLDVEFYSQEFKSFYTALMFGCEVDCLMDSNIQAIHELRLQDKYFTFRLKNLSQVLFFIENGVGYAVTKPMLNGTYKKMEINEFFAKEIGFGGVEFMTDSDEEQEMKNYKFTPCDKIFKEEYYFNPKILH